MGISLLLEELDNEFGASKALLVNATAVKERIEGYSLRVDLQNRLSSFL